MYTTLEFQKNVLKPNALKFTGSITTCSGAYLYAFQYHTHFIILKAGLECNILQFMQACKYLYVINNAKRVMQYLQLYTHVYIMLHLGKIIFPIKLKIKLYKK